MRVNLNLSALLWLVVSPEAASITNSISIQRVESSAIGRQQHSHVHIRRHKPQAHLAQILDLLVSGGGPAHVEYIRLDLMMNHLIDVGLVVVVHGARGENRSVQYIYFQF